MNKSFNPWPLGIALVYGGFATAMIGFVIWSRGHKVDLVAPDYYAQEIAYQQEIDALTRSQPHRDQVRWKQNNGSLEIEVAPPLRDRVSQGLLRLYRPSDSSLDQDVPLALDANGRFSLDTRTLLKGFWRVRLEWIEGDLDYALETSLFF